MSGTRAAVLIAGIAGVALVTVAAVCMGHDGNLVTGAMSAITGITAASVAYYKGKESQRRSDVSAREAKDGNTKADSGS